MEALTVCQHFINDYTPSLHRATIPQLMMKSSHTHTPAAPVTINSKEETCKCHEEEKAEKVKVDLAWLWDVFKGLGLVRAS